MQLAGAERMRAGRQRRLLLPDYEQIPILSKPSVLRGPIVISLVLATWTNHLSFVLVVYSLCQRALLASHPIRVSRRGKVNLLSVERAFGMYRALFGTETLYLIPVLMQQEGE